jgi:hypothetical protein
VSLSLCLPSAVQPGRTVLADQYVSSHLYLSSCSLDFISFVLVGVFSLSDPNPALVVCATMNTYTSLCVDSRTCPASDQNKIFIAYLVLVIVFMLHALFELLYAIFAAKMSEYTEEDFDLNAGFSQSISVAIVKMVPLLSLLVHLALLGAIAFARTVNTSSVVTCVRSPLLFSQNACYVRSYLCFPVISECCIDHARLIVQCRQFGHQLLVPVRSGVGRILLGRL